MTDLSILVINQYYRPDVASSGQLLAELCQFLCETGISVDVVTGQPSYTSGSQETLPHEDLLGVQVHRVSLGQSVGRTTIGTRLMGYIKFLWRSWRLSKSIASLNKPNIVLTLSNPPIVGLIGGLVAKTHGIPYVYVLYDIHPDILLLTNWIKLPFPIVAIWNRINSIIFRYATIIIVPSESMRTTLVEKKNIPQSKIKIIPNWARPEISSNSSAQINKSEIGMNDQDLLFIYAGNIGIMQQLDPILDAASLLKDKPIKFLFLGDGTGKPHMEERVSNENLSHVSFLPYQPEDTFTQLIKLSDACFVTLEPGLDAYSAPSRAYTFMSAGSALITIMEPSSELAKLVTSYECGWNVTTGKELARLLTNLLDKRDELVDRGKRSADLYLSHYKKSTIMQQYVSLIHQLCIEKNKVK